MLSAIDERPVLVSILGGAWILMGFFGVIQGAFLATGWNEGITLASSTVEQTELDALAEFDDPSAVEAKAQEERYTRLNRSFGVPWIGISLLGGFGGLRLVRRRSWSRSLILAGGLGALLLAALHAYTGYRVTMDVGGVELLTVQEVRMFKVTAIAGAVLNSVPAIVGVSLLRHSLVRDWVSSEL